ncbi:MAG: hypothetical protein ACYC1M_11840 [Armatimonadota bacterium]
MNELRDTSTDHPVCLRNYDDVNNFCAKHNINVDDLLLVESYPEDFIVKISIGPPKERPMLHHNLELLNYAVNGTLPDFEPSDGAIEITVKRRFAKRRVVVSFEPPSI